MSSPLSARALPPRLQPPRHLRSRLIPSAILALALTCPAAFAALNQGELLILKDGSRITAEQGYEVQGKRVVYENLHGVLTMIRLDEVDFEAMEQHKLALERQEQAWEDAKAYRERSVVDVSNVERTDSALGRHMSTTGSIFDYARLARDLGVDPEKFAGNGPDVEEASQACTHSLSKLLNVVWKIDLHRKSTVVASAEQFESLASSTSERAAAMKSQLSRQTLQDLSEAYRGLARLARNDPQRFVQTIKPWMAPAGG